MNTLKLFKILIGCTPKGRHTEQHDIYFGIGKNIADIIPQLKIFWKEAASVMHIDAYREVTFVDGYKISIAKKNEPVQNDAKLFFINLGGYKKNEFDEFHFKMIIAANTKADAIKLSKQTAFYKHNSFKGAESHIDDKYGIDVDDIHNIEDILLPEIKNKYSIVIQKTSENILEDVMHLGYFKLSKFK